MRRVRTRCTIVLPHIHRPVRSLPGLTCRHLHIHHAQAIRQTEFWLRNLINLFELFSSPKFIHSNEKAHRHLALLVLRPSLSPVPGAIRWQDRHRVNGPGERTVWKSTGQVPGTLRRWDRHRVERARREDCAEEHGPGPRCIKAAGLAPC